LVVLTVVVAVMSLMMIFAAVLLIADCLESEAVHLIRRVAGGWRNL